MPKQRGRPARRPSRGARLRHSSRSVGKSVAAQELRVAVIGVGNPLMGDDGAGIAVLKLLSKRDLPRGTEILDMGTGGMALLHALAHFDAIVIADAVDMDTKPGTVRTFSPDDVVSVKELRRLSLHEGDIFETIVLARQLGQCPEKITICAIQPKSIAPKIGMTRSVRGKLPMMASQARRAVERLFEDAR